MIVYFVAVEVWITCLLILCSWRRPTFYSLPPPPKSQGAFSACNYMQLYTKTTRRCVQWVGWVSSAEMSALREVAWRVERI